MTDQLRPGQRIVDYAYLVAKIDYENNSGRVPAIESWLWNLSEEEFKKVMNWSPNND